MGIRIMEKKTETTITGSIGFRKRFLYHWDSIEVLAGCLSSVPNLAVGRGFQKRTREESFCTNGLKRPPTPDVECVPGCIRSLMGNLQH